MEVTIDRISNNGNPIAEEKDDGHDIVVLGAKEPGESLEVQTVTLGGTRVGLIINPTAKQRKRAMEQMTKEVRVAKNFVAAKHYRTPSKKEYDYGGTAPVSGVKKISDEEREAAKDRSKSLDDIAEDLGDEVTNEQDDDRAVHIDDEEADSELASEVAHRHD